jgi:hypothetical protein
MRHTGFVCVLLAAMVGTSSCTSHGGHGAAETSARATTAGPSGAGTARANGPAPVISSAEVAAVLKKYAAADKVAEPKRSIERTKAIQAGPMLTTTLSDYRYDKGAGRKPHHPAALVFSDAFVPALTSYPHWFLAAQTHGDFETYVSLFEQARAGASWRKTLMVYTEGRSLSTSGDPGGAAVSATAPQVRQGKAAVKDLSHYLATGKVPRSITDTLASHGIRTRFKQEAKHLGRGATTSVHCSAPSGSVLRGLGIGTGSQFVASLRCTATYRARPNYILSIQSKAKGLASHRANLHTIQDHYLVQVALTLDDAGRSQVVGQSWQLVAITSR